MNVDNSTLTNGGTAGGGEVLQYMGTDDSYSLMDENLIKQFGYQPIAKIAIVLLICLAAVLLIMRVFKVRNPMRGKTISRELDHINQVKRHDDSIIKANRYIKAITNIIESSPFKMGELNKDYWSYNLTRANVRIPGKSRIMKPEEFNALVTLGQLFMSAVGIIIGILFNPIFAVLIIMLAVVMGNTLPMMALRSSVKAKDSEIQANFADMYLMLHYVLLASASTPISGILKSFDKTTNSEEMHRFVDTCVHYIDTYGEFEATSHIAKQYREISEVGKLMRLIKQANEGGDIRMELVGFRDELIEAKRYALEKRMNKMIARARASFSMLYVILIQAIISAMAIYADDLGGIGDLLG